MKSVLPFCLPLLAALTLDAAPAYAGAFDVSTLACSRYENEVLPAAPNDPEADSIDTVMWLFGYSVAKSGQHVLYADALAPFGFALDNECKSNPTETVQAALGIVKPETKSPLDLAEVECESFAAKHAEFARTDTESAKTIMMWLFGFGVGASGGHLFEPARRPVFESSLLAECARHPHQKLLEAIRALRASRPARITH